MYNIVLLYIYTIFDNEFICNYNYIVPYNIAKIYITYTYIICTLLLHRIKCYTNRLAHKIILSLNKF